MFAEYEVVKLKYQKAENLPAGMMGTIVIDYKEFSPHLPPAYEVEFIDDEGYTIALLTLNEDEIEKVEDLAQ